MPGSLRVSEKEAIARGWIAAPVPVRPLKVQFSAFPIVIGFLIGWFVGFAFGLAVH